jgi:hypothetical protein
MSHKNMTLSNIRSQTPSKTGQKPGHIGRHFQGPLI